VIQIGKEEVKFSLLLADIILPVKDLKYSSRTHVDLINTFSKVAGYKMNIQTSGICLYTKNDLTEKEIRNTFQFTTASKKQTQKIGTNLPKMLKTSTMKMRKH
jgi:hypothetical protein